MKKLILNCPHCDLIIEIEQLNCSIFRHGVFKNTNQQINQHETKKMCEKYVINDEIYGCGKPFKIINNNNNFEAIICDYI